MIPHNLLIVILCKFLALQIIGAGLYVEWRSGAGAGSLLITSGSLLFAACSNVVLFYSTRRR